MKAPGRVKSQRIQTLALQRGTGKENDLTVLNGLNCLNYFMSGSAISGLRWERLMKTQKPKIVSLAIALFMMTLPWPYLADAQQPGKVYRVGYLSARLGIDSMTEGFQSQSRQADRPDDSTECGGAGR
jgi:hypothetical protein